MSRFYSELQENSNLWLITGVAGFIGSNILEYLLKANQKIVGLDNFSTGLAFNLKEVERNVTADQWKRFKFIKGDIRDFEVCNQAMKGVDYVLHQAALGSVPRSIESPRVTHDVNINGFLNVLDAAKAENVKRIVYAASSSTYGDHPALPKREDIIGKPLSPYAVTKYVNELYADVYSKCYGLNSIGLRYFNVFGKRQNPLGPYAAVIPTWIEKMLNNETIVVYGDGETTRDFCHVDNVIQANILAVLAKELGDGQIMNIAVGKQTSLNKLIELIKFYLEKNGVACESKVVYGDFRSGDVRHSLADVSKATNYLGYKPLHTIESGLKDTVEWYLQNRHTKLT